MTYFLRLFIACCIALMFSIGGAQAQEKTHLDYVEWNNVAERAADAIENNRASEAAMGELRSEIVSWRHQFADEGSRTRVSVQTLEAQLSSLGPVPESGDPDDVAEARAKLTVALSAARAPERAADLAHTEAEELIRAIDSMLRGRQAVLLLEPGPLPLNPAIWPDAVAEVLKSAQLIVLELVTGWTHETQSKELRKSLPAMLFYFALGLLLIVRGVPWTNSALKRSISKDMSAPRWVGVFMLSFGQVILPMLGVFALTKSVYASDLAGLRGDVVLSSLPLLTFELLVAKWLGERIFSGHSEPLLKIHLTESQKRAGRRASFLLGISLALATLFSALARYDNWDLAAQSVVFFGLTVVGGLFLSRLGILVGQEARQMTKEDSEERTPVGQIVLLISRLMILASVVGLLLGIAGLTRASSFLVFSMTKTVLLAAFLLVIQRLIQKIFAALEGRNDDESSLASVLTGGALVVLALPALALTWGARSSDLAEGWTRLINGLDVGGMTLSPRTIALFLIVYCVGHATTRLFQSMLRDNILPKTSIDPGGQNAIVAGLGYVGIFIAALVAMNVAGIDLGNVALFAGALSVGIGFGLQTVVSNFVSGIILLIERPISEGDWIEVGGEMGYVRDISVRSTRIETFDRTDVVVPNSDLISGTVTNFTRGNTVGRVIVPVGVAYGSDTRQVESVLREIAEAHPMVLANPAPSVVFQGFGADSLDFEIRAILRDVNWVLSVKSDMNHEIARKFAEAGLEIPFAQRDVWLRNPEVLPGAQNFSGSSRHNFAQDDSTSQHSAKPMEQLDSSDFDGDGDGDGGDGK